MPQRGETGDRVWGSLGSRCRPAGSPRPAWRWGRCACGSLRDLAAWRPTSWLGGGRPALNRTEMTLGSPCSWRSHGPGGRERGRLSGRPRPADSREQRSGGEGLGQGGAGGPPHWDTPPTGPDPPTGWSDQGAACPRPLHFPVTSVCRPAVATPSPPPPSPPPALVLATPKPRGRTPSFCLDAHCWCLPLSSCRPQPLLTPAKGRSLPSNPTTLCAS